MIIDNLKLRAKIKNNETIYDVLDIEFGLDGSVLNIGINELTHIPNDITDDDCTIFIVDKEDIEKIFLFSGYYDNNGDLIWEGDKVIVNQYEDNEYTGYVKFEGGVFFVPPIQYSNGYKKEWNLNQIDIISVVD